MADVEIGQRARIPMANDRMRGLVVGGWGRADRGYCLLHFQCAWTVAGDETVFVDLGDERSRRVSYVATTARRWRTATGARVGVSGDRVRSDYPNAITRQVCFEGDHRAVLLPQGERTTVLVMKAGHVRRLRSPTGPWRSSRSPADVEVPPSGAGPSRISGDTLAAALGLYSNWASFTKRR